MARAAENLVDYYNDHLRKLSPNELEKEVARIIGLICEALGELHVDKGGIIHCDLKPENIMVDEKGDIKIIDFGSSVEADSNGTKQTEGPLLGTSAYLPPEICDHEKAARKRSFSGDMWAVGVMLHTLLVGRSPPLREWTEQGYVPMISDQAKDLVEKLLCEDPAQRPTAKKASEHASRWMESMIPEHD